ncbi:SRPBCC family protein [Ornithinimicrobium faecis]|uniref:SRPBCC family protein n=1 Tax=Ornithinimicrobium faecis TaxID=2934158 RepID=A0ABY4YWJ3_9MICO|nr:SRPBCC family protein [Ornithinimicrobium sp. HY1793]USQ81021.1 SRPBCC family protein [Ornithinimicrobium sp. HY1793]
MGTFEIARTLPADPEATFRVLGDLAAYGQFQPLTRISPSPGPIGPGWSFVAHTGIGPLSITDRMVVTQWDPGEHFTIVKIGPVLDGGAEVHLTPEGDGTRVVWREEIVPRPGWIGRRTALLTDPPMRWFLGRSLDQMAARVGER